MTRINRIGKLIVCNWAFKYDGIVHTIPMYIDIKDVVWRHDGSIDFIQVNLVYQPYQYLTGQESYYSRETMGGDKIPVEVMTIIKHENLFKP